MEELGQSGGWGVRAYGGAPCCVASERARVLVRAHYRAMCGGVWSCRRWGVRSSVAIQRPCRVEAFLKAVDSMETKRRRATRAVLIAGVLLAGWALCCTVLARWK